MTAAHSTICIAFLIAQLRINTKWGFAPLVLATCWLPDVIILELGVGFTLAKLLILFGILRAGFSGIRLFSFSSRVDVLFLCWAIWAVLTGFAHNPKDHDPVTVRASMAYDYFGAYLYARAFLPDEAAFHRFAKGLLVGMVGLAAMMYFEKATTRNVPWTVTTGSEAIAQAREGRIRAGGSFRHPILAGTAGAGAGILLGYLARQSRKKALIVGLACGGVVFCSASSGPLMTAIVGIAALALWKYREKLTFIKVAAVSGTVLLHIIMDAPVWYLIARMDLAGGSTGWHRAELITQAINHFGRWWMVGTDYTRDWIGYGIDWSADMVDITNLYIQMGVRGGLLLLVLFVLIFSETFRLLGRRMRELREDGDPREFALWCCGSALFAHCVNFLSVTYFDQSAILLMLTVGAVPALCAATSDEVNLESPVPLSNHSERL